MLVPSTLRDILSQVLSPSNVTAAILVSAQSHLISYAASSDEDIVRVIVGLGSELWAETVSSSEHGFGLLECTLGRIIVVPIYTDIDTSPITPSRIRRPSLSIGAAPSHEDEIEQGHVEPTFLLMINGTAETPWGLLRVKAKTLADHFTSSLGGLGEQLAEGSSPPTAK